MMLALKFDGNTPMLRMSRIIILVCLLGSIGMGSSMAAETVRPLQSIITDLERHIAELSNNIEKIQYRIDVLHQAPSTKDVLIQQLREQDLKGWELHQEQWRLQLSHLRYTEEVLRNAHDSPGEKPLLLKSWVAKRNQYHTELEAYRQQRHGIEEQRLKTEGQMIEQYLR